MFSGLCKRPGNHLKESRDSIPNSYGTSEWAWEGVVVQCPRHHLVKYQVKKAWPKVGFHAVSSTSYSIIEQMSEEFCELRKMNLLSEHWIVPAFKTRKPWMESKLCAPSPNRIIRLLGWGNMWEPTILLTPTAGVEALLMGPTESCIMPRSMRMSLLLSSLQSFLIPLENQKMLFLFKKIYISEALQCFFVSVIFFHQKWNPWFDYRLCL